MTHTDVGLLFIVVVLCEYTVLASLSTVTFKKRANQYLTCSASSQMYSTSTKSAVECTLMCNKETSCISVNYDRLGSICELLSVNPFQIGVSTAANTDWTVYHKDVTCDGDWVRNGIHCYLYNNEWMTWEEARQYCLAMNANLVYIDNDAENTFVAELAMGHDFRDFWMDLTDIEAENVWKWSSGSTSTYEKFASGEPTNSFNNEHCVSGLKNICYEWNDRPCMGNLPSICKLTVGE